MMDRLFVIRRHIGYLAVSVCCASVCVLRFQDISLSVWMRACEQ